MTLMDAKEGEEYIVKEIVTEDDDLEAFLFSLDVTAESRLPWFPVSAAAARFPSKMGDII